MTIRRLGFPDGKGARKTRTRASLSGTTGFYSFGELFDRSAMQQLHSMTGLTVTEFSRQLGIPFATCWNILRSKTSLQLGFLTARKISEWRSCLFRQLMSDATQGADRYGRRRIIQTVFPNLRDRYSQLVEVLRNVSKSPCAKTDFVSDALPQYLIEQALMEQARPTQGTLFKSFLPWAPDLVPFLKKNLDRVHGALRAELAVQAIAQWLGTTPPVVKNVLHCTNNGHRIKAIPPREMRLLILGRRRIGTQKSGRPPRNPAIVQKVQELLASGKSLKEVQRVLAHEDQLNLTIAGVWATAHPTFRELKK